MSYSINYDYQSCSVSVTPISSQNYWYRVFCRTGGTGGTGKTIFDGALTQGSFTETFSVDPNTTYTVNVLYYSSNSYSDYVGNMGAESFTTPSAPSNAYIYTNGQWRNAKPYIYTNGQWKPTTSNVYTNNSWHG